MPWHLYHHRWHFPKGFASWAKLLCLLQESPGFNSGPEVVGAGVAPQISQLLVIIGSRCCGTCVIIAGTSQRGSRLGPSSWAWLSSPLTTVPPTHKNTHRRALGTTHHRTTRQYDIRPSLKAAKTREPPLYTESPLYIREPPLYTESPLYISESPPVYTESPPLYKRAPLYTQRAPLYIQRAPYIRAPHVYTESPLPRSA